MNFLLLISTCGPIASTSQRSLYCQLSAKCVENARKWYRVNIIRNGRYWRYCAHAQLSRHDVICCEDCVGDKRKAATESLLPQKQGGRWHHTAGDWWRSLWKRTCSIAMFLYQYFIIFCTTRVKTHYLYLFFSKVLGNVQVFFVDLQTNVRETKTAGRSQQTNWVYQKENLSVTFWKKNSFSSIYI